MPITPLPRKQPAHGTTPSSSYIGSLGAWLFHARQAQWSCAAQALTKARTECIGLNCARPVDTALTRTTD